MHDDRMFELAQALATAKSRQDLAASLAVLHPDMVLGCPAFGTVARGVAENEKALDRFFKTPSQTETLSSTVALVTELPSCAGARSE